MAFQGKVLGLKHRPAREFFVQAAVRFDDPPERCDVFNSLAKILLCRLRDNPEEYSGTERSGKVGLKILRQT